MKRKNLIESMKSKDMFYPKYADVEVNGYNISIDVSDKIDGSVIEEYLYYEMLENGRLVSASCVIN